MHSTDVTRTAIFRVRITEYGTREKYFALLKEAANMEPDRIALTMPNGFLVEATTLQSVLIRFTRAWRKCHRDVEFDNTPPLHFNVEPLFTNSDKVEVFVGDKPSDASQELMRILSTFLSDRP